MDPTIVFSYLTSNLSTCNVQTLCYESSTDFPVLLSRPVARRAQACPDQKTYSLCFQISPHSLALFSTLLRFFALAQNSTRLFSAKSAFFHKNMGVWHGATINDPRRKESFPTGSEGAFDCGWPLRNSYPRRMLGYGFRPGSELATIGRGRSGKA
jgi:hypothetical protein